MTVNIFHVEVCFNNKIITVNILTDKIVCVGYPATIIFGGWQLLMQTLPESVSGDLDNYHLF